MGCNEDHSNKKTQESQRFTVQDSEKLLGQMTSDKDYRIMDGEFMVWQTPEKEIVFVNPAISERNMFILQGANATTDFTDGNYQVLYLKHSLLIQNKNTGENLYLKVPKKEEEVITTSLKKNIELKNTIEGYGLVFGTMNLDPNNPSAIDYIKDQASIFDYLNTTVTNKIGD